MDFHAETAKLISKHARIDEETVLSLFETPPEDMGDIAFPCFRLAKEMKKSPQQIAQELAEKVKAPFISKTEAKGPYLNVYISPIVLAKDVLDLLEKQRERYGSKPSTKRNVMVEFSSPNTNKPLHLGHLRNIFIGQSTLALLQNQGLNGISATVNNDRGIHICKSMYAYEKWGAEKEPDKKTDHFVGDFYVKYEKNKTPETEAEIKEMLRKWESKDQTIRALWKKMNAWAFQGFQQTYERLGVSFDAVYYESGMYEKGKSVVKEGLEAGLFIKKDDGNIIADLSNKGLGEKVVLRADGTSVYVTQDLYLADLKFSEHKLEKSIYVVANEQNYHFKVLFELLRILEREYWDKCYHLNYGMVNLPEGRMKSREGTVVDADNLLDEIHAIALNEIKKRHAELSEDEAKGRAETIAQGALRFFILKSDASQDMTYDPKESMSFEGETGPYLLYVVARINSILRKEKPEAGDPSLLVTDEEQKLIKHLWQFPEVTEEAANAYKPHLIARWLLDTAQAFNTFYHEHQVLKADPELKDARLRLIQAIKQGMENGLKLLGIETVEEM
ncbi:MAG: arginine--tRNA ligase [Candidatus Woesearchaeota archaeon]